MWGDVPIICDRMKSRRRNRIAVAITALVVVILFAVYCIRGFTGWDSVTVELDAESSLRVSRKPMHPFLAEYHRKVAIIKAGQELSTLSYPPDPGGCFPMLIRFYSDNTRRVVRLTDYLNDRLIDLRTSDFVPEEMPPDGKEFSSFVHESSLPPLRRSVEIDREMQLVSKSLSAPPIRPN